MLNKVMFYYRFLISRSVRTQNAPASSIYMLSSAFKKSSTPVLENLQQRRAQNRPVCDYSPFTKKMMKESCCSLCYLQYRILSYSYTNFSIHQKNHRKSQWKSANRSTVTYMVALAVAVMGLSYAAVPLYRLFCQASGYGGTVVKVQASEKIEKMEAIRERELTIRFNADTSAALLWNFKPNQQEIRIVPGETALAFYSACNPTDRPVTGIATYNVIPFEAGLYFNKIQCFCFEEQRLNPHEQVDMPVFFYIDPEFDDDPAMAKVDIITLSYTFFESKDGDQLPPSLSPTSASVPVNAE